MKLEQPSIIFNGYFRGTIEKEAELSAYTTFKDVSALSVLENEDINYVYAKKRSARELKYMNNVIMVRNMIRNFNDNDSITFITITCSRTGEKKEDYRYTYSANIVIVEFEQNMRYCCSHNKMKMIALNKLNAEYEAYKNEINIFRDIGFNSIKKEEKKESQNEKIS